MEPADPTQANLQLPLFELPGAYAHSTGECADRVLNHLSTCESCCKAVYGAIRDLMCLKGWL